jgi:hypothetical protein
MELVQRFLARQSVGKRDQYVEVLRGLHSLRRRSHYDTVQKMSYDLKEDTRFWRPKLATPSLTPYQLYASKIPLGDLASTIAEIMGQNTTGSEQAERRVDDESGSSEVTATDATHVTLEEDL